VIGGNCRCGDALHYRERKAGFDATAGFASNGYGAHSPGGYSLTAGLAAEMVLTFVFLIVILDLPISEPRQKPPVAIGLALTLIPPDQHSNLRTRLLILLAARDLLCLPVLGDLAIVALLGGSDCGRNSGWSDISGSCSR